MMVTKAELDAMVGEFLEKGNRVKVCATGERAVTDRDIYLASRGLRPKAGLKRDEEERAEHVAERRMEVAREAVMGGDRQFAEEVAGGVWDDVITEGRGKSRG